MISSAYPRAIKEGPSTTYSVVGVLPRGTRVVNHVAIYLGNGQMMEAAYATAAVASVRTTRLAPNVKRVFP